MHTKFDLQHQLRAMGILPTDTVLIHTSMRAMGLVEGGADGVLDAFGDCEYENAMERAISELEEQNPGVIAERLLQLAIRVGKGHIRDDMTILVAGVWEKSENA